MSVWMYPCTLICWCVCSDTHGGAFFSTDTGIGAGGNMGPWTEANAGYDPEACHIVLSSPIPKTMYTWDVYTQVGYTLQDMEALGIADTDAALATRATPHKDSSQGAVVGSTAAGSTTVDPEASGAGKNGFQVRDSKRRRVESGAVLPGSKCAVRQGSPPNAEQDAPSDTKDTAASWQIVAGRLLHRELRHWKDADEALIGDAGAVAIVIDASLGTYKDYSVRMELQGQHTRGMTVLDPRRWEPVHPDTPMLPKNVAVVVAVDAARMKQLYTDTVLVSEPSQR
eukprot:m.518748 g.518748  ORF g.518748 m.518748 type:complete len:283 (+) comp21943_c0_seq3:2175-3023(+)